MVTGYQFFKRFKAILKFEVVKYISGKNAQFYAYLDPYMTTESDDREAIGNSNLLDDARGANMYERMATMALFNQAFYATDGQDHDFAFELATRTLPNIADPFKEMYATKNGKSTITHTSTYKTAVSALLYSENVDKTYLNSNYRFNVKSINYSPDHPVRKNYPTTPYLYIADIVCGYILDKIRETFSINESTSVNKIDPCLLSEFCSKTGIQVQIYDKTDALFREMVQYAKAGSLEKYQYAKYCILNCGLLYQDFYKNFWIPKLEDYIHRMLRNSDYRRKVKSMIPEFVVYADGFMGSREINYEAGLFVAAELSTIVSQMDDYRDRKIMLFRLYDIILRGHNHRGAIVETQKYISKCEEYKAGAIRKNYCEYGLIENNFHIAPLSDEQQITVAYFNFFIEAPIKEEHFVYYLICIDRGNKINTDFVHAVKKIVNLPHAKTVVCFWDDGSQREITKELEDYLSRSKNVSIYDFGRNKPNRNTDIEKLLFDSSITANGNVFIPFRVIDNAHLMSVYMSIGEGSKLCLDFMKTILINLDTLPAIYALFDYIDLQYRIAISYISTTSYEWHD